LALNSANRVVLGSNDRVYLWGGVERVERTREEHVKYCKEQAYHCYEFHLSGKQYAEPENAIRHACTTMLVDMGKHPETAKVAESLVMMVMFVKTEHEMRKFIDGFN